MYWLEDSVAIEDTPVGIEALKSARITSITAITAYKGEKTSMRI